MKTFKLPGSQGVKVRKWFRPRHRSHDPMLVFSMSIFNSGSSWARIFSPICERENVWR
jgi:hypothetical protein